MRTPHLLASACTASDPEARYHQAELAIWDELTGSLAEYPRIWRSPEGGSRWKMAVGHVGFLIRGMELVPWFVF